MKRTRGESLTGGTGDVNPQLITQLITNTTVNGFIENSISLPVNRLGNKAGKSVIIEILKVFFDVPEFDTISASIGGRAFGRLQLSTISQTTIAPASSTTFAYSIKTWKGAFSTSGTFESINSDPAMFDLTDGAGHGLLIATDKIFLAMDTFGFAAVGSGIVKILYRFKEVALTEYIGIVQSQQ